MLRKFPRSTSPNDLILLTLRELSKQYSKLELITTNLRKRDKDLFEICKSSLEKGQKERATIYANEVAEIRKTLAVVGNIKLALERAIARLETIRAICPTMTELRGLFGDVKSVLKLVTNVMPVVTPEMDALNSAITEILSTTQAESVPSIEPVVIKDASAEAILQEATGVVQEELMRKIPEPPIVKTRSAPDKTAKPMIALTTDGAEIYKNTTEHPSLTNNNYLKSGVPQLNTNPNSLSEELVLDYIYRTKGEVDIAQCAEELGMSQNDVLNMLDLLNTKGKIKIER